MKTASANWKRLGTPERALPRRRAQPCRHAAVRAVPASGAHAEVMERPPVTALWRRELSRDARGKWTVPGGANPPAGAPPVARHWPPERRTSPAMPWPLHACVCHRRDPTSSKPTSREYINQSSTPASCARPTTAELHRPPFASPRWAHCSARFHGYLSIPKTPPCSHWAYTPACWLNRAACSPKPELPRPSPDSHRRARSSAGSPSPETHLAPYLGHMEATVLHIVELRSSSRRNPSFCGRAATAPPSPLAGGISGRVFAANPSLVSPITLLARLFASPSLTSQPASAPPPSGYGVGNRGYTCELSKVPGAWVHIDSIPFVSFSSIL
jgi:hypothetical protein